MVNGDENGFRVKANILKIAKDVHAYLEEAWLT